MPIYQTESHCTQGMARARRLNPAEFAGVECRFASNGSRNAVNASHARRVARKTPVACNTIWELRRHQAGPPPIIWPASTVCSCFAGLLAACWYGRPSLKAFASRTMLALSLDTYLLHLYHIHLPYSVKSICAARRNTV